MADPVLFDPRVEELLREIAADPDSTLLRVPRPARLSVVLERRPLVGVATAGLSAVERELVRVHRHELAHALRQLAVVMLYEAPSARTSRTKHNFIGQVFDESRDSLSERARALDLADVKDDESSSALALLRASIPGEARADVPSVAAASTLLEPTSQASIYAAQHLSSDARDWGQSRLLLQRVLERPCSPSNAAAAAANLGWIESQCDAPDRACEWYARAVGSRSDAFPALFGWLWTAAEAGRVQEAMEAGLAIESLVNPDDSAVNEYVDLCASQVSIGMITPSPERTRILSRVAEAHPRTVGALAPRLIRVT